MQGEVSACVADDPAAPDAEDEDHDPSSFSVPGIETGVQPFALRQTGLL